jgi:5-methylcytosine-specific restriction endonuclease McrA
MREKNVFNYNNYLRTDYWRNFRKIIINKRNKCLFCGCKRKLVVHHKYYYKYNESILYKEREDDVIVLCENCHNNLHKKKKRKVKVKNKHKINIKLSREEIEARTIEKIKRKLERQGIAMATTNLHKNFIK